jgi:hypothetical protein
MPPAQQGAQARVSLPRINEGFSTESSEFVIRKGEAARKHGRAHFAQKRRRRNARLLLLRRCFCRCCSRETVASVTHIFALPQHHKNHATASTSSGINESAVVKEFADGLTRAPDMAVAVAAIRALTGCAFAASCLLLLLLQVLVGDVCLVFTPAWRARPNPRAAANNNQTPPPLHPLAPSPQNQIQNHTVKTA